MTISLIPGSKRKISPSSMNTWYKCPRLYYYKYIKHLPEPTSIHLVKGTIIHTVLQMFFGKYENDLKKRMFNLLDKYWSIPKELDISDKEEKRAYKDCKAVLEVFLNALELKYKALMTGFKAENKRHAFYLTRPKFAEEKIQNKNFNLIGIIDCVKKDFDGNIILADYKTGSSFDGMNTDTKRQLSFYVLLYYLKYNKYPQSIIANYVRYGIEKEIDVTPSLVKKVILDINHFIMSTQSDLKGDYPKHESNFCSNKKAPCPFFDICNGNKSLADEHQQDLQDMFKTRNDEDDKSDRKK